MSRMEGEEGTRGWDRFREGEDKVTAERRSDHPTIPYRSRCS